MLCCGRHIGSNYVPSNARYSCMLPIDGSKMRINVYKINNKLIMYYTYYNT